MRLALLGRTIPPATLGCAAGVVVSTLALRLVYPVAALLFGHAHTFPGSLLVVSALALSFVRAQFVLASTHRLRHLMYSALGVAIHRYPVVVARGQAPREQIENEISRGIPSVEILVAETLPSLVGSCLALPVVGWLAVAQVGARSVALAALALGSGIAVAALLGRAAARRGKAAWSFYQRIATLIEQGFVGRAELRVHRLEEAHQRSLLEAVEIWTAQMRGVRALQAITAWSVPIVAVGVAIILSWAAGQAPGGFITATLVDPHRAEVLAWALALAALPIMTSIAGAIATTAGSRPYWLALDRFVKSATATPYQDVHAASQVGEIEIDAEYTHAPTGDEQPVTVCAKLSWAPGELLAVTGPNGAGKSTLSLLLMGLVNPTRGAIRVGVGDRTENQAALVGRIGYLPQSAYFDETGSLRDAMRFVAPDASDADLLAMLSRLQHRSLDPTYLDAPCSALSSGQRRTLALARVLLRSADLLVLDEPEANLDLATRREAISIVREVARRKRIMLLTHDPEFAAVADRVVRFDDAHRLVDSRHSPR